MLIYELLSACKLERILNSILLYMHLSFSLFCEVKEQSHHIGHVLKNCTKSTEAVPIWQRFVENYTNFL